MKEKRTPFYLQLRDTIASQIASGKMPAHAKLPSERELTHSHELTRVTVRQALMQLESEGLIYRLLRRGWYVSPPRLVYDPTQNTSFMENVLAQGRVPATIILSKQQAPATALLSRQLNVARKAPVFSLLRKRSIDGLSVLVETIQVNAGLFPDLLDIPLDRSLTKIFEKHYGIKIARSEVTMYPAPLHGIHADELQVVAGTPGLFLTRTSFDRHDNIIEYDEEFWRHDALQVSIGVSNALV